MNFDRLSHQGQLVLFYKEMCYTMWYFDKGKAFNYESE